MLCCAVPCPACWQNLLQEVRAILERLLSATPPEWQLVIEDATGPGLPGGSVGLAWQMAARGRPLPLLSGLSHYWLDSQGRIRSIREASEQVPPREAASARLAPLCARSGPSACPLVLRLTAHYAVHACSLAQRPCVHGDAAAPTLPAAQRRHRSSLAMPMPSPAVAAWV